ncbi:beta-ketoacyl synthase N-terminal-like domain-containing protein [Clostridium felsineum]|uniref:beta-ketoacyl synthase N-terminal-like domain-containing protein n=1 Tax=Clostridium felsineum TaxID=36839 RepID=UPI00098C8C16|nr:beta-ketoacyl synthase N-terminal-like domain-containing protein [Clostridium felsineum]URZ01266.1 Polyketide synthase PksM [Clostridium felsineum]
MRSVIDKTFIANKLMESEIHSKELNLEKDNSIAVIGMSVRMPHANNLEEFWTIIKNGLDCVEEFPESRKKYIEPFLRKKYNKDNFTYSKGSYLQDIEKFDYNFWGITPKEADMMEPIHRLFLETAYETLESAGYGGDLVNGSKTGVFVGTISDIDIHSYKEMIRDTIPQQLPIAVTGTLRSTIAAMLSYYLNLRGPNLMVDTACSSSLVAVHEACQSLRNGECSLALAAGAKINLTPLDEDYYKIGIESSDGETRTFDDKADGSGFGEGIAVLLLKPYDEAIRDHDYIHAVIKGSAVNHGGTSLGLTVPNAAAQEQVLEDAWKASNINPEDITYIECHGTATKLGDPIEISAVNDAFLKYTNKKNFCAVGSIKSNFGHLFECSGIVGMIKAILCLKMKELPPTINFDIPNEKIHFIDSAVYVNSVLTKWNTDTDKRYCGVSSFGIGGVNCHAVLEEYQNEDNVTDKMENREEILTLSAKSQEALLRLVDSYVAYLDGCCEQNFKNICYTSNIGKRNYEYRIAVYARSCHELKDKLFKLKKNNAILGVEIPGVWTGHVKKKSLEKLVCDDPKVLCEKYIHGMDINWLEYYRGRKIGKVVVPAYSFERNVCWFEKIESESTDKLPELVQPKDVKSQHMYYNVRYRKNEIVPQEIVIEQKNTLIFSDGGEMIFDIAQRIKDNGSQVFYVTRGDSFKEYEKNNYSVPFDERGYTQLFQKIDLSHIKRIIYAVSKEDVEKFDCFQYIKQKISNEFYGLFYLVKMLSKEKSLRNTELILLTNASYVVNGKEEAICPTNAAIVGFGRNINLEFSNIKCKAIDYLDIDDIESVMLAMEDKDDHYFTAVREQQSYIEEFFEEDINDMLESEYKIHENGVYIVTGGVGKIGLSIAEYLSCEKKVSLVFMSRSKFPDRSQWEEILNESKDHKLCSQIKRLMDIVQKGSNVYLLQGDVSNEYDVQKLIKYAVGINGVINGIVHAAGVTGNGFITTKKEESIQVVLNPKIYGTWLLDKYTEQMDLDFFMMCSSGVGIIGEIGLADYTAANAYLDSFAYQRGRKKRTLAVDWVVWKNARMAEGSSKNVDGFFKKLEAEDAIACLDFALKHQTSRVLIGEINFQSQYIGMLNSIPMKIEDSLLKQASISSHMLQTEDCEGRKNQKDFIACHNKFDVESVLCQIVCHVIGFTEIDVNANLFELGVNSILLNYIYKEIDDIYPNVVLISDLFANSTITQLAKFIEGQIEKEDEIAAANQENIDEQVRSLLNELDDTQDIDYIYEKLKLL